MSKPIAPMSEAASPASSTGPRVHTRRRFYAKVLLLFLASLACLLFLECLVRVALPRFDPRNQLKLQRNAEGVALGAPLLSYRQGTPKGDFDVTVSFNRHGFRDRKDFLQAGTNDVLVTGDSFSLGWGVEEEDRYSNLLEKMTGVPFYNISTPGEDLRGYRRVLTFVRHQSAKPSRLVLGLCMENDLWDYNHTPDTHQVYAQQAQRTVRHKIGAWFRTHSALWMCCAHTLQRHALFRGVFERLGLARNVEDLTHKNETSPGVVPSSRDELLKCLEGWQAVVLIIPSRGLWHGSNAALERKIHEDLVASLRQAGVGIVDLKPVFEQTGNPLDFYYKNDPHWNPKGHAAAAQALARYFGQAAERKFLRRVAQE